jgi:hypothetical protein
VQKNKEGNSNLKDCNAVISLFYIGVISLFYIGVTSLFGIHNSEISRKAFVNFVRATCI